MTHEIVTMAGIGWLGQGGLVDGIYGAFKGMIVVFITVSATFRHILFQLHSFFLCQDTIFFILTRNFSMQTVTHNLKQGSTVLCNYGNDYNIIL